VLSSASKWKDASSGQHVEYDQRPDIFRFVNVVSLTYLLCLHIDILITCLYVQGNNKVC
jgi:hypothetical protein